LALPAALPYDEVTRWPVMNTADHDQQEVIEFLSRPAAHHGAAVERIDTHTSIVFLAGNRALKLKRAVHFDYVDYSTVETRRVMCEAEVRLNARTAADLYRGVIAVRRQKDGALDLGGEGAAVDWLVEMRRFDQSQLFDRLAARGLLGLSLVDPLAEAIATFHRNAEPRRDHGGRAGMEWVVRGNDAGLAQFGADLDLELRRRVTDSSLARIAAQGDELDARRDQGYVRHCHGDLHLRNIVLWNGRPTLFDGIEFNDELACVDVYYDLAFLLMDLWKRRLCRHANRVLNRYLRDSRDIGGLALLPLFLSCRAAIRAKTSVTAAAMTEDEARRRDLRARAAEYLAMADELLRPPRPCLVAIGGLSGSGKTTLAAGLAPTLGAAPGAIVLRSDEIRKELCGVDPLDRLGAESYHPQVSAQVYRTLAGRACEVLRAGLSVIADAVYARPEQREAIARAAEDVGVPFVGVWLEAPEPVLRDRLRLRTLDASDADAAVLRQQLREPIGDIGWARLDAAREGGELVQAAAEAVAAVCHG
jgi:aminoglycoside phosphotransferase family enzyme/predicted kinase